MKCIDKKELKSLSEKIIERFHMDSELMQGKPMTVPETSKDGQWCRFADIERFISLVTEPVEEGCPKNKCRRFSIKNNKCNVRCIRQSSHNVADPDQFLQREEVCIWEYIDWRDEYKISCKKDWKPNQHFDIEEYVACPYCGKKIKIKE